MNLSKWLPFKFHRKGTEDTESEAKDASVPVEVHGNPEAPTGALLSQSGLMERMFHDFLHHRWPHDPFSGPGDLDRWFGDFAPARFQPSIDVTEEDGSLCVSAEIPGIDKDEIELSIENNTLTIKGEKKNERESEEGGVYRTERYYGFFQRSVPLPEEADQDSAEAKFENGVLQVRFRVEPPKDDKSRRISIKS